MKPLPRVLVVGPAPGARGGISSVIAAYQQSKLWKTYRCEMVETFREGSRASRIGTALAAYAKAFVRLPFFQVVHIHLAGQSSLLRKLPVIAWSRLWRKKLVTHIHASGEDSLFGKTPGWAVDFVFRSSDRVVALSPTWMAAMIARYPKAEVTVIPNPAILPEESPKDEGGRTRQASSQRPSIVFTGKLEQRKGYRDLLEAASYVVKEVPDAQFLLAGHGEIDEARKLSAELGIAGNVHCLGWLSREEVHQLLRQATAFCLPSYDEGVPMSMLEAMSYAVPTVTTPVGGIPDVITSEKNGLLVAPGNPKLLAGALSRILASQELQARLGQAARDTIRDLCGLATVEGYLDRLYTSVLPH